MKIRYYVKADGVLRVFVDEGRAVPAEMEVTKTHICLSLAKMGKQNWGVILAVIDGGKK